MSTLVSLEYLYTVLNYNSETGIFTWIADVSNIAKSGDIAGALDGHKSGYIKIQIKYKRYLAHRLAWFYVYGVWPTKYIDHVNRVRTDNRLVNLREANELQNSHNRAVLSNSTTKIKGIRPYGNKFIARISVGGKRLYLGIFNTAQEAKEKYESIARLHHREFKLND